MIHHTNTLEKAVREYIDEICPSKATDSYYSSLVRRYSFNLFEALINRPFQTPQRYSLFDEYRKNFYSLALYGDSDDIIRDPSADPMHYKILYHEFVDNVENNTDEDDTLDRLILAAETKISEIIPVDSELYTLINNYYDAHSDAEKEFAVLLDRISDYSEDDNGIPLFAIYPNPKRDELIRILKESENDITTDANSSGISKEEYDKHFFGSEKTEAGIVDEFRTDVSILQQILNVQVMNAIAIEIPYFDLIDGNITALKASLENSPFTRFINKYKELILSEKYRRLEEDNERRKKRAEILSEISEIVEKETE